jgi:hypothetical protein
LVDHNTNISFSKGHLIHKPENRNITFATISIGHNSDQKLVPFLPNILQDINKRSCFASGAAGTEIIQFPQPIILYWLDCPNEKNMHDQVDHSKPFSSGSPPPGSTLRQRQHRRKIKKSLTALPPSNVLVNNSSRSVTAPVRSDSDILHDDDKPPRKSPKKKGNKKGKHYRRAVCKGLNLPSETHCEENIDAASPVEVLTDLLADKLSETSSSASSLVKEAHFGEENGGDSGCTGSSNRTVGEIFSCKDVHYLNDESNNYERSLCARVSNSNDAIAYSLFKKLERDNSVNCSVNDEVRDSCHPIGAHLSITHAEDSNDSFGCSSCCSKNVADSSNHTERVKCSSEACSSKTSLPVIPGRSRTRLKEISSYSLTATNGVIGTNKNKHSGKYSSTSVWQKVEKLNVENTSRAGCMVDSAIQNKDVLENINKVAQHNLTRSMKINQRRKACNQHSPDERIEMEHAKENDALNSCQAFSRYKYKKQTSILYQQTSLSSDQGTSQSSGNYHAPKNGIVMVPKNHLQQKDGLPMMQLVYDKDSSVDTGVGSNGSADGDGSSQSGFEKAALASCNMGSYLVPQDTCEECTSTMQADPHYSSTENKAISTNSNSRNLCADPSPAEMDERCYVKLTMENTPQECPKLYSATGKQCKLYSAAAHVSQKWVAVGKKNILHFDGSETSAVDSSVLTNCIPISANIGVETNVSSVLASANNEVNKLAAEISDKPNSSGHLDLRCQPHTDTGTDFNKMREAVCDAYRAQQRVEDVQVIIGRPLADFEQFISSASPVLYCSTCPADRNFCSPEWVRDGLCFHQSTDITLSRIWQWYEEPCCYGLEVKAQDFRRSKGLWNSPHQFTTYFVPYLSAVQLFGQAKRASTGRVDKEAAGMDVTSKTSPCPSSLPILTKLLPQQLRETISSSDLYTKGDQQFGNGELIFEFFESEQPFWRRQLFDK